mmetsp:Transcript_6278/g.18700  ORF Transcript_6278/g.18700 Transcript_6278/m.18700 type:complete len:204 (+) Transcript_6278:1032-1643(+)
MRSSRAASTRPASSAWGSPGGGASARAWAPRQTHGSQGSRPSPPSASPIPTAHFARCPCLRSMAAATGTTPCTATAGRTPGTWRRRWQSTRTSTAARECVNTTRAGAQTSSASTQGAPPRRSSCSQTGATRGQGRSTTSLQAWAGLGHTTRPSTSFASSSTTSSRIQPPSALPPWSSRSRGWSRRPRNTPQLRFITADRQANS